MSKASGSTPLSWRVKERSGLTTVEFHGEIDENSDLSGLRTRLTGPVVFDLESVDRINSCGVREWVNFVRDIEVETLVFSHCSPSVVTQLNMIYNFRGDAVIRSFYAPYVCEDCDNEIEKLLDVESQFPKGDFDDVPTFVCEKCSNEMEFDDIPERYFSFLKEA
jgi:anti-anti-sigma regulatory factor